MLMWNDFFLDEKLLNCELVSQVLEKVLNVAKIYIKF